MPDADTTTDAVTSKSSASIAARLDRLPATRTVWMIVALLSLAFFFELHDMLLSAYIAPGLVRDGLFTTTTAGLFGLNGIAAFIAALFAGLTVGTLAAGALNHDESHRPVIERHFGKKRIRIFGVNEITADAEVLAGRSRPRTI